MKANTRINAGVLTSFTVAALGLSLATVGCAAETRSPVGSVSDALQQEAANCTADGDCSPKGSTTFATSDVLQAAAKLPAPAPSPGVCTIGLDRQFDGWLSLVYSTPVESLPSRNDEMAHLVKYETKDACDALTKLKGVGLGNVDDARKKPWEYIGYHLIGGRRSAAMVDVPGSPFSVLRPYEFIYDKPKWIELKDIPAHTNLVPYDFKWVAKVSDLELPAECTAEGMIACSAMSNFDEGVRVNGEWVSGAPRSCIAERFWAGRDFTGEKVAVFCYDTAHLEKGPIGAAAHPGAGLRLRHDSRASACRARAGRPLRAIRRRAGVPREWVPLGVVYRYWRPGRMGLYVSEVAPPRSAVPLRCGLPRPQHPSGAGRRQEYVDVRRPPPSEPVVPRAAESMSAVNEE